MITSGVGRSRDTRCSASPSLQLSALHAIAHVDLLALQLPGQLSRAGLRRSNAVAVCVHSDTRWPSDGLKETHKRFFFFLFEDGECKRTTQVVQPDDESVAPRVLVDMDYGSS